MTSDRINPNKNVLNLSSHPQSYSKSLKLINTELDSETEQKLNVIEPILQASNKKQRTQAILQAAETLGKSPRTIRRMINKIAHEGVWKEYVQNQPRCKVL